MDSTGIEKVHKSTKTGPLATKIIKERIPICDWLPKYEWKSNFLPDLLAGFTLACIHVPQSLAFAVLANVDLIIGLYSACFSTFIYILFGTATVSSFGPVAIASMLTGEAVVALDNSGYSNNDIAFVITFFIGVFYFVAFVLRLGVLASIFIKPFTSGLIAGCALHILIKSFKHLLGLTVKNKAGLFNLGYNTYDIIMNLGNTNIPTLIVSIIVSSVFLVNMYVIKPYLSKHTKFVLPIEAITMIIVSVLSYFMDFPSYGILTLSYVPTGIPELSVPAFGLAMDVVGPALAIALINFSTTTSMTMFFNKDLRPDQELLAMSVTNMICSFFQCLTVGNSMMRTVIAVNLGLTSLMASVMSSLFLLLIVLFAGPLFSPLPYAVLGCIIVVSVTLLLLQRFQEIPGFMKSGFDDMSIWALSFFIVVFADVSFGMLAGATLSLRKLLYERVKLKEEKERAPIPPEEDALLHNNTDSKV